MRLSRVAFAAIVFAAPLSAEAGKLYDDPTIGPILGIREYAVRLMEQCFDTVEARPLFMETAENWKVRNLDDIAVLERAIARVAPSDADWAQVNGYINPKIKADISSAENPVTICELAAERLNSGAFDLIDAQPDAMMRLRAAD